MAQDLNRITVTARLTKDPELYTTDSGFAICNLRIVANSIRKNAEGEFVEKPNYFDLKVFGKPGENASKYLSKGSQVAVDGRLETREYTTSDGQNRQATEIIVDMSGNLRYLSSPNNKSASTEEFISSTNDDDDIPF